MSLFLATLTIIITVGYADNEEGLCAPYHGKICSNFINNSQWVWYADHTRGSVNEEITTGLWKEMISGLKEPCRNAAEVRIYLYFT